MWSLAIGQPRGGRGRWFGAAVLACLSLPACRQGLPADESAPSGAVVARVGGRPITAGDVVEQMRRRPGLDSREALDQRITFEVLARAAESEDLSPSGEDATEKKKIEVQRLVERELEPQLRLESIPDADVRALYERGQRRFVHGRLVQTTVLCLFTGARMSPERRARVEESAKLLGAYLAAHPVRTSAEMEAVAKDPQWAERKVSVTTVWQDQTQGDPFPAVVAHALASLHAPGDRTPLIGDETGYYVALYLAEQPAQNQSFEQVASTLRAEMFEPWRRQRFLRLTMDLSAGHDIAVFPENLDLPTP